MADLVACVSENEKSWGQVKKLVDEQEWGKVFLISGSSSAKNIKTSKKMDFIIVDIKKPVAELINDIKKGLDGKVSDLEVALNIVSGSGKEHMAILSALLKLGVGIRLMAATKEGIKEL